MVGLVGFGGGCSGVGRDGVGVGVGVGIDVCVDGGGVTVAIAVGVPGSRGSRIIMVQQ